jgi:hypothetical protein
MVKIRNGMKSASLRKLYTVGDAITSFKTAVALGPLLLEPNRESTSSDCLLAAIQLENSFENPLYIKCTPPVSSIKSKDSEAVKYGKRKGEIFLDNESAIDFNLQPTTTMTTPHKFVKLEGATYFIGKCRAGDYVFHSWNLFGLKDGYCGATVCFFCDDGYEKEVVGPYLMSSGWRTEALATHLEMPEQEGI